MAIKLVTPPASYPVDLDQMKKHLNVDFDDDNAVIEAYIAAAVSFGEKLTGRAFIDQTWDFYLDEFPDDGSSIEIPKPPLIEVDGVYYTDSAGAEQTYSDTNYIADSISERARISLLSSASWPSPREQLNAVRIRFRAGYLKPLSPAEADVPGGIKNAIILRVKADYDDQNNAEKQRDAAKAIFMQHRVETGMA